MTNLKAKDNLNFSKESIRKNSHHKSFPHLQILVTKTISHSQNPKSNQIQNPSRRPGVNTSTMCLVPGTRVIALQSSSSSSTRIISSSNSCLQMFHTTGDFPGIKCCNSICRLVTLWWILRMSLGGYTERRLYEYCSNVQ